ncbi:hypothetical protein KQX54_015823 [Cotesia glomerata]|uniref:Uncharacterized protein n=1 Tax=Cotesia glomerata TaxID=32391 RepID=A0AAV7IZC4_COTGL|nr:hypothetical protein KQX54_015823 [Cotesia glomerata]
MPNIRFTNSDEESDSASQDSLLNPSTKAPSHSYISPHQAPSISLPPPSETNESSEIIKPPDATVTVTQMSFGKISSTPLTPAALKCKTWRKVFTTDSLYLDTSCRFINFKCITGS